MGDASEASECVFWSIMKTSQDQYKQSPKYAPQLGDTVLLSKGIRIEYELSGGESAPFFFPSIPHGIRSLASSSPPAKASFSSSYELSFHYGFLDLVSAIYGKWKLEGVSEEGFPPELALGYPVDTGRMSHLADWLGVNAEDASTDTSRGFVLVKMTKVASAASFKAAWEDLHPHFQSALQDSPSDSHEVSPLLSQFETWGTHYISQLTLGDQILQVFVYQSDKLKAIEQGFPVEYRSGPFASIFEQYTQPGPYGYAEYAGKVFPLSADPAFEGIRPHLKDESYHVDESIFQLKVPDNFEMLDLLEARIPIACSLSQLASLLPDQAQQVQWHSVWDNGLVLKYNKLFGNALAKPKAGFPYQSLYKSYRSPFPTTYSTNQMTIGGSLIDLKDIKALNPENVDRLVVFADVVELTGHAALPGKQVFVFCREFRAVNSDQTWFETAVSKSAYADFNLYCDEFQGTLLLRCGKSLLRKVLLNGQSMTLKADGGIGFGQSFVKTPAITLLDSLADPLSYAAALPLLAARSFLEYPISETAGRLGLATLNWLDLLFQHSTHEELLGIALQAFSIVKNGLPSPDSPRNVPYQSYPAFAPLVSSLVSAIDGFNDRLESYAQAIEIRKSEERTAKSLEELNQNLQQVGQFLLAQNDAFAAKENDITKFKQAVIDRQNEALEETQKKQQDMLDKLNKQQDVVDKAFEKLKREIAIYIAEEAIQFAMDVALIAVDIYQASRALRTLRQDTEEAKEIKKTSSQIKEALRLMKGFNDLLKQTRTTGKTSADVRKALKSLHNRADDVFPSKEQWNEYDLSIYAALSPLSSKISYANTFIKEIRLLAERGRAYIDLGGKISQIQYQLFLAGGEQDISKRQADRLSQLDRLVNQPDLSPAEASQIDLFLAGGILQSHAHKLTLQLAKTLQLQDAALQYYYLQQPSPIHNYEILGLKETIVNQAAQSVAALENFNPPPADFQEPVEIAIKGVSTDRFGSAVSESPITADTYLNFLSEGVAIDIPLDHPDFINYVRVRVNKIEVEVEGITSTDSGKVDVQLLNYANPFQDRDFQRQPLSFKSIPQRFAYVYELETGKGVFGNGNSGPLGEQIMKLTPFGRWLVKLPQGNLNENKGMRFAGKTVDIKLRFWCNAIRLNAFFQLPAD